jgi:hypothetical protein
MAVLLPPLRRALAAQLERGVLSEFSLKAAWRGLIGFAVLLAVGLVVFGWSGWLQHTVELWIAYAVPCLALTLLYQRSHGWISTRVLTAVVLLAPLAGAALSAPVPFLPSLAEDRTLATLAGHFGVAWLFALGLTLLQLSFGVVLQRQRRQAEARQRALVLEREVLASRLSVLQAQIEPHFLYNTLANVQVLTRRDPAAAEQMLTHLIDYLRSAMPAMRSSTSTIGRELDLAQAYLSIMQIRMGARLAFAVHAPEELRALPFPPTVVGTFIENAIKHGLEPARAGGRIDVRAWREADRLWVEVADTGVGIHASSGSGVGLANARERLRMLYGPAAELDLAPNTPSGIIARACIPLGVTPAPAPAPASAPAPSAPTT